MLAPNVLDLVCVRRALERIRMDYEDYRDEAAAHAEQGESARAVERRLRLAVLREKRQAVTEMRDANEIDDIVLRELQAGMDAEEVRLLGPVVPE